MFALNDLMFRLYMMQKGCKFDIFGRLVIIKVLLVLRRQLMDTILKEDTLSFLSMYYSPFYITQFKYAFHKNNRYCFVQILC